MTAVAVEARNRIFASTAEELLNHRQKVTAGLPGCTCGISFCDAPLTSIPMLHAKHVSEVVTCHVLDAAVDEIRADLKHYVEHPERWAREKEHDSYSAKMAITRMVTREGRREAARSQG